MQKSTLNFTRNADGSLLIEVPSSFAISDERIGTHRSSLACHDCYLKDQCLLQLRQPCAVCAVMTERVSVLTKLLEHIGVDHARLGALEQELSCTRPAYHREQEALQRSKSARIGERGEQDIRARLLRIIGSHANVEVTNRKADAGDLQLQWHPEGLSRPALITVEVKTGEEFGEGMLQTKWIQQAQTQVRSQNADAGLLLFTGSVDATRRLLVQREARLVVVGFSHEDGQILSGILHAFIIAQQKLACEQLEGTLLTPEDSRAARHATALMQERVRDTRLALFNVHQLADKALKIEKEAIKAVAIAVSTLPPTVSTIFPPGFTSNIALPRERLEQSTLSSVNAKPLKYHARSQEEDCEQISKKLRFANNDFKVL